MLRRRAAVLGIWLAALAGVVPAFAIGFDDLTGWADDDHSLALAVFLKTCPTGEGGVGSGSAACRAGAKVPAGESPAAKRFFESWFEPEQISAAGFLTGYYEPEFSGCLQPDPGCRTPLLARPADYVELPAGERPPGWPVGMTAARRTAAGLAAYPDRAAIEEGGLGEVTRPVAFLADPVDAFMVHVQGSARIRLKDGGVVRVGFDGRNGYPYTSVARVLADRLGEPPAAMTADRMVAWLKAEPEAARELMRANRSFIFFRRLDAADPSAGPLGGAGVALTAGRSLAVDRASWPYGTPVWLEGELPRPEGGTEPLRRLAVAQDTGAAIVGVARGDLFVGSGETAGLVASRMRQSVRWVVLRPREAPAGTDGPGK